MGSYDNLRAFIESKGLRFLDGMFYLKGKDLSGSRDDVPVKVWIEYHSFMNAGAKMFAPVEG